MDTKKLLADVEKEVRKNPTPESMDRMKELLSKYDGDDRIISSADLVEEIKNRGEEPKVMSGFVGLDAILSGFRYGQLISLSALTKSGKTSFMVDLTTRLKDQNPLWFPLEEHGSELVQKFIDRNEPPPAFFLPRENNLYDITWVERKIVEGIVKYGSKIVFIDHLGYIVPRGLERNDLLIEYTMKDLKQIARRWGVIIVLAVHVKKTGMYEMPDADDIKGSAAIGQESDTVMFLWREAKREDGEVIITDNATLSVQANRRTGKTGNVRLVFRDGKFYEEDWKRSESEAEEVFGKEGWKGKKSRW